MELGMILQFYDLKTRNFNMKHPVEAISRAISNDRILEQSAVTPNFSAKGNKWLFFKYKNTQDTSKSIMKDIKSLQSCKILKSRTNHAL